MSTTTNMGDWKIYSDWLSWLIKITECTVKLPRQQPAVCWREDQCCIGGQIENQIIVSNSSIIHIYASLPQKCWKPNVLGPNPVFKDLATGLSAGCELQLPCVMCDAGAWQCDRCGVWCYCDQCHTLQPWLSCARPAPQMDAIHNEKWSWPVLGSSLYWDLSIAGAGAASAVLILTMPSVFVVANKDKLILSPGTWDSAARIIAAN